MESHQKSSILLPQRAISFGRNKKSSNSVNGDGEYSEPILPIDLVMEIMSRLPAKSLYRFRCVSKLWASILHRPYFKELFLTRSSSRPQVLFAFLKNNKVFFYSTPQPRNHDEIVSPVVATFVTKTQYNAYFERFSHFHGSVFLREEFNIHAVSVDRALIFNPSTRQTLSIPKLNLKQRSSCKYFLGYDPIEKQYKLLSIAKPKYQVLTLGSGKLIWTDIFCSTEHSPRGDGICVNGVLYYIAGVKNPAFVGYIMIVSFDIKSEKFKFMETMENNIQEHGIATLINYNGKLAVVKAVFDGTSETLTIWVLEDPKKEEWSNHIHVLPPLWKYVVGKEDELYIVGVIGTNEIVYSSICDSSSFYLVYYNTKRKSIVKVEIHGMESSNGIGVYTFLNHVENLNLLF